MKAKIQVLFILATTSLCCSIQLRGQETHSIKLNVDTVLLTEDNIDEMCDFGQDETISNKEYMIEAALGDIIIWTGVSTSSQFDKVHIKAISYDSGVRIFSGNLRDYRRNPGYIKGIITRGAIGDVNKYKITFEILNNDGRSSGTFQIDPKIKIIQGIR